MLKVAGDSMIGAAIADGDWVVIRQQSDAESGEIVAAMIDGEATVKTLKRTDNHAWLMRTTPPTHQSPRTRRRSWAGSSPCYAGSEGTAQAHDVRAQALRQRVRVRVGVAFAAAMDTGDWGDAWIWG